MPACPEGETYDRTLKKCRAKKSPGRKVVHHHKEEAVESNLNKIWVANIKRYNKGGANLLSSETVLADSKESLEHKVVREIQFIWEDSEKYSSQEIMEILRNSAPKKVEYYDPNHKEYRQTEFLSSFSDEKEMVSHIHVKMYLYHDY
jgi:hypothetical protein